MPLLPARASLVWLGSEIGVRGLVRLKAVSLNALDCGRAAGALAQRMRTPTSCSLSLRRRLCGGGRAGRQPGRHPGRSRGAARRRDRAKPTSLEFVTAAALLMGRRRRGGDRAAAWVDGPGGQRQRRHRLVRGAAARRPRRDRRGQWHRPPAYLTRRTGRRHRDRLQEGAGRRTGPRLPRPCRCPHRSVARAANVRLIALTSEMSK